MQYLYAQAEAAAEAKINEYKYEQWQENKDYQDQVDSITNQLMELNVQYPDVQTFLPQMEQFIQDYNLDGLPNAIEIAYKAIKGDLALREPQSVEDLLQDENFLRQAAQNETIRAEVLREHAAAIRGNQPPPLISGQSGIPPAAPKEEIKSTRDAAKASLSFFNRILGRSDQ